MLLSTIPGLSISPTLCLWRGFRPDGRLHPYLDRLPQLSVLVVNPGFSVRTFLGVRRLRQGQPRQAGFRDVRRCLSNHLLGARLEQQVIGVALSTSRIAAPAGYGRHHRRQRAVDVRFCCPRPRRTSRLEGRALAVMASAARPFPDVPTMKGAGLSLT